MRSVILTFTCVLLAWSAARPEDRPPDLRPYISPDSIPVERMTAVSRDGHPAWALVRRPPGAGPFPAIVLLHGGEGEWAEEKLRRAVLSPLPVWFLSAGYVVVQATFRLKMTDMLAPHAVWDCLALVEKTKTLAGVDPASVVVWGTSGGGSMALELAAGTDLAAAAAWEPGTQLFAGIPKPGADARSAYGEVFADPRRFYTEERIRELRGKLAKIRCPVFIDHGDVHPLKNLNFGIFLPELMSSGRRVVVSVHPGMDHGTFYNPFPGRMPFIRQSFEEYRAFFRTYLKRQPSPLDPKHLRWIPDTLAPANPEVQ